MSRLEALLSLPVYTKRFAVHQLSAEECEQLSQRLYPLHNRIFDGVSYEKFRQYVVFSPAWRTWLFVRQTPVGEWVGYTAVHAFRKTLKGRPTLIFRMETGSLPDHRGQDLTVLHVLNAFVQTKLRHWRWPAYLFSSLVHPSGYALVTRYVPKVWPNYQQPMPAAYAQLLHELAQEFDLAPVATDMPGVRQVHWITRETTPISWDVKRNPHVAYFLEANPGYRQGYGLLTLIPSGLPEILGTIARFIYFRGQRWLRIKKQSARSTVRG